MKAWYFAPKGEVLRYGDGRKIAVGKMHTVKGEPALCQYGLHGSVRLIDALSYAQSSILYRVEISRHVAVGSDKIVGQRRTYLVRFDAEKVLMEFARKQALVNIEKIELYCMTPADYQLIVLYLQTGKEELREAAYAAAYAAYAATDAAHASAHAARAACAAAYDATDAAHASAHAAYAAYAFAAEVREEQNTMLTQMVEAAMLFGGVK